MQQISFYLKKFKTLSVKGDELKKQIIETVKDKTKIDLKKEDIIILKNGVIKINKTGPEKSIIFLNKDKIETELEKKVI